MDTAIELAIRVEALEAENKRLREALHILMDGECGSFLQCRFPASYNQAALLSQGKL